MIQNHLCSISEARKPQGTRKIVENFEACAAVLGSKNVAQLAVIYVFLQPTSLSPSPPVGFLHLK